MNEAASRKILIRADAGGSLGTGHVMRMLALSQALRKRGIKVILASIQCPEPIVRRLQSAEVEYHPMDKGVPGGDEDNSQTLQLAKEAAASWVVLDGYHFTHAYQQSIHSAGFKLAVMDDFDHTDRWCADLVINQNLGAETKDYDNDVDGHRVLAGHCFALLREEFASISTGGLSNAGPLQKILVTMGGVDSGNATGEVLQLLDRINVPKLDLKVVAGGGNPHMEALEKLARSSRHSIMLVQDVEDMGSLYTWADGVVSAGGSTCYEWLSHRLPAAIVQLADNQGPIVEALASRGAALSLGPLDGLNSTSTAGALADWVDNPPALGQAYPHVDGKGASRVAAALDGKIHITIATAEKSWINHYIRQAIEAGRFHGHGVNLVHDADEAPPGDILFLLSYWSIVPESTLRKHTHNLVVHASDLPKGKGWSPVTWQILEGCNEIPFCLFEAVNRVDAGPVFLRDVMVLQGHELLDDIRRRQAAKSIEMCTRFTADYPFICPLAKPQAGKETFYPRRSPDDSELDPNKSLAEQFNLLRTVDNEAYPAFFEHHGVTYFLTIERKGDQPESQEEDHDH